MLTMMTIDERAVLAKMKIKPQFEAWVADRNEVAFCASAGAQSIKLGIRPSVTVHHNPAFIARSDDVVYHVLSQAIEHLFWLGLMLGIVD